MQNLQFITENIQDIFQSFRINISKDTKHTKKCFDKKLYGIQNRSCHLFNLTKVYKDLNF